MTWASVIYFTNLFLQSKLDKFRIAIPKNNARFSVCGTKRTKSVVSRSDVLIAITTKLVCVRDP